MEALADNVRRDGFAGPVPLLTPAECALVVEHLRYRPPASLAWHKGLAVTDRLLFDLATRPPLMALLRALLGEDVILWGASVVARSRGDRHAWHCDIETAAPEKRSASVWIGLQNTTRETALLLMARSHLFGRPFQRVAAEKGIERGEAGDDTVLSLARELDPEARIEQPDAQDGEALVFDGRLWHGSDHAGGSQRLALLLQYAAAETEIGIPDPHRLDWPFGFRSERPPALLVSGEANGTPNWLVPGPPGTVGPKLAVHVQDFQLPPQEEPGAGITRHPGFCGWTPNVAEMESHVSVLSPGVCPHSPQTHVHEELHVILDGEGETLLTDGPWPTRVHTKRCQPGDFAYYPAYQHHTIRASGDGPLTYVVFKWWGEPANTQDPATATVIRTAGYEAQREEPLAMEPLFEQPTAFLSKLHSHLSVLQPGAGYDAHVDEHDVALVVLSGRIEVCGQEAASPAVLYLAAGEAHDMKNIGDEPARYLVLEFHAPHRRSPDPPEDGDGRPEETVHDERDRMARELHTVLTSTSWRITQPLRRLMARLR